MQLLHNKPEKKKVHGLKKHIKKKRDMRDIIIVHLSAKACSVRDLKLANTTRPLVSME